MTRESYRRTAREILEKAERSDDPERQRKQWLERLLHQAQQAEQSARTYETAFAAATDAMQRAEAARRAAQRAQKALARLHGDKRREQERILRNARQREAYKRRRATEGPRLDTRTGTHAIAIEVDRDAYAMLKVDARHRAVTIPRRLGEILTDGLTQPASPARSRGPRWHRTGGGRRADIHVRVEVANAAWDALHENAFLENLTVARWIGRTIEEWSNNASRR